MHESKISVTIVVILDPKKYAYFLGKCGRDVEGAYACLSAFALYHQCSVYMSFTA